MDKTAIHQLAIDDLLKERHIDEKTTDAAGRSFLNEVRNSLPNVKDIGTHAECGSRLYCACIATANLCVPGENDYFRHICEQHGVVERLEDGYVSSTTQDEPLPVCPGCKTEFI